MEVASPLTFGHVPVQAGKKRRFDCSPLLDATTGMETNSIDDYKMDECNAYGHNMKKRRRYSNECHDSQQSSFSFATLTHPTTITANQSLLGKRQRNEDYAFTSPTTSPLPSTSNTTQLEKTIEKQNSEIHTLRQEKHSMQSEISKLTESQEKTLHENKILKKAVALQQHRQNAANNELTAARNYKVETDNKIKALEQVINSLRYHLQAQQPHVGNDFLGLNQRPPDVY